MRRRHKKWLKRMAVVPLLLLVGYLGILAVLAIQQRKLIYHPAVCPTSSMERWAQEKGYTPWKNLNGQRIGYSRLSRGRPAEYNVLVTHGNAGTAVGRDYIVNPLQEAVAADVWILEYPGFADRPGPISQESLLEAAEEGWSELPKNRPVVLVGESLGSGMASNLASRHGDALRGVLLLVPFNNLPAAARQQFPWVPVQWILKDRYPSDEWLKSYRGRLGVVVAGDDQILPPVLGRTLFEGFAGPKRLWELSGMDHMEGSQRPATWWKEAFTWLQEPP